MSRRYFFCFYDAVIMCHLQLQCRLSATHNCRLSLTCSTTNWNGRPKPFDITSFWIRSVLCARTEHFCFYSAPLFQCRIYEHLTSFTLWTQRTAWNDGETLALLAIVSKCAGVLPYRIVFVRLWWEPCLLPGCDDHPRMLLYSLDCYISHSAGKWWLFACVEHPVDEIHFKDLFIDFVVKFSQSKSGIYI